MNFHTYKSHARISIVRIVEDESVSDKVNNVITIPARNMKYNFVKIHTMQMVQYYFLYISFVYPESVQRTHSLLSFSKFIVCIIQLHTHTLINISTKIQFIAFPPFAVLS